MRRHIQRHWRLYLAILLLFPLPIVRFTPPRLPPVDQAALQQFFQRHREAFLRRHPGATARRYEASIELQFDSTHTQQCGWVADLLPGGAVTADAVRPDLEALLSQDKPVMRRWDALTSAGVLLVPAAMMHDFLQGNAEELITSQEPPIHAALEISQMRTAGAMCRVREGRWAEAIGLLEAAARAGEPVRYIHAMGFVFSAQCRPTAYAGYTDLLQAGPPREAALAALDSLRRLGRNEPQPGDGDDLWLLENYSHLVYQFAAGDDKTEKGISRNLGGILSTARGIAEEPGVDIKDPGLRAWRRRTAELQSQPAFLPRGNYTERHSFDHLIKMIPVFGRMHLALDPCYWTAHPASIKFLKRLIATQPELFRNRLFPPDTFGDLDPWTLAMIHNPGQPYWDQSPADQMIKMETVRVWCTRRHLLMAGFAAQAVYAAKGRWPASLDELAGLYPAAGDLPATATPPPGERAASGPMLPVRIARLPLTHELRLALWGSRLPLKGIEIKGGISPDGSIRDGILHTANEPIHAVAIGQAMGSHPMLVADVRVEAGYTTAGLDLEMMSDPFTAIDPATGLPLDPASASPSLVAQTQMMTSRPASEIVRKLRWERLDAALARRITDESKCLWGNPEFIDPATGLPMPGAADGLRKFARPQMLRLNARLQAPGSAVVIWSPGPDGKDDGGQIAYDPSNGTFSRGDILLFPEKF